MEVDRVLDVPGIPKSNRFIYDFENRIFSTIRRQILETLEKLRDKVQPDLVLIPSIEDTHQDHSTTAREGRSEHLEEVAVLLLRMKLME